MGRLDHRTASGHAQSGRAADLCLLGRRRFVRPGIQTYNTSTGCLRGQRHAEPEQPLCRWAARTRSCAVADDDADFADRRCALAAWCDRHQRGSFGDNWNYSADFTISNVRLNVISKNYLIPQRLADVIAQGTYNFVNQSLNSQAIRDYISPVNQNVSNSDLWQGQVSLGKSLFKLPGGDPPGAAGCVVSPRSRSTTPAPTRTTSRIRSSATTRSTRGRDRFAQREVGLLRSLGADPRHAGGQRVGSL